MGNLKTDLVYLPDGTWNKDKKELVLGHGTLQISIVQPNIQSNVSSNGIHDGEKNLPDINNKWRYIDITVQDVLLRRYFFLLIILRIVLFIVIIYSHQKINVTSLN